LTRPIHLVDLAGGSLPPRRARPFDIEIAFRNLESRYVAQSNLFDTIGHTGIQGSEREELIREFLREHLPSRFAVARGEIRDRLNNRSREFDALIFDRRLSWKLYRHKQSEVLPIEAVYATVEVKKRLTKREVSNICEASFGLGALEFDSSSRLSVGMNEYGAESTTPLPYVMPFVIAFDGPPNWRLAVKWFEGWWRAKQLNNEEVIGIMPHCLCVVGKYSLKAGVTESSHRPGFVANREGEVPLLSFYLSLFQGIDAIRLTEFNLLDYEDVRKYFDAFVSTDTLKK